VMVRRVSEGNCVCGGIYVQAAELKAIEMPHLRLVLAKKVVVGWM